MATEASILEQRLSRAEQRVREYLSRYGATLPSTRIAVDPALSEGTLATHRYPATVVVRDLSVPESVIAHELVHIAQGTLEQFKGFRLLYTLLAEGLADWLAKALYPEHEIKYQAGVRLIETLASVDERMVGNLLRLNDLPLALEDVDTILASPLLADYTRNLLLSMAERIRDSTGVAVEAGITDPTFITLGEEVRAWKFVIDKRFQKAWDGARAILREWFQTNTSHPSSTG